MAGEREKLVQVEIYGQSYNLRGDADPSYIQELSSYVDAKMQEIVAGGGSQG